MKDYLPDIEFDLLKSVSGNPEKEGFMTLLLRSSDIFVPVSEGKEVPEGHTCKFTIPQNGMQIASTNKLESALKQGLDILVVTTRPRTEIGDWDQWWIELVCEDNILFGDENIEWGRPRSSDLHIRAFDKLGLSIPSGVDRTNPNALRWALLEQQGVIDVTSFVA